MVKAGRPQGGPKGQSEQANALAVFLRNLTKDLTVRELADRYAGGKTLWGEYRAGTKTVHLHLLESLVHDTVRDARSRTELLARARRLHAEAVAAQRPAAPAEPDHVHQGVSPEQALGQATTTLQDAERLIHILLGVIAGLQMQATSTGSTGVAAPVPLTAAQSTQAAGDLREAQDRLVQVRLVHDAVTRVRDEAAAFLPAPHPTDTEQSPGGRGRGDDTALPARYAAASRGAAAILLVSRAALAEQHNAARILSARTAGVGTVLYGVEASSSPAMALPPTVSPGASEVSGGPQAGGRSSRWRTALVATAAAVALTAVVSGAVVVTTLGMRDHESPQAAGEKGPGPAAAAPGSSPAPSVSPSPTDSVTPSPTPSTGLSSLPAPVRTRSTSTVPDRYVGVWEGEFTEPGEQAPSLRRIVVRKGAVGAKIADVITLSRTSLCQAEGTLRSTGALLVITPRPTSGTPAHLCTPAGDIALRRDGDAGLTWKSDGITVPLHRASSHSAVPTAYVGTWRAQDGNDPTSTVRMTIRQGVPGTARAEFTWDGDAHHCEGFSVLASAGDTLAFGPETVTASEPEGFCTQTPSRTMTRPDNGSMHMEMAAPDGTAPRAFTFTREN